MRSARSTRTQTFASALALATVTVGLTSVLAAPADARGDREVIRRGSCTGSADWKVKAKNEDGRIEVEGEVDSNHSGQTWKWKLFHNGDLTARGRKTTHGASGSFEVERVVVNLSGNDHLRFRARNVRSGQVCNGSVDY